MLLHIWALRVRYLEVGRRGTGAGMVWQVVGVRRRFVLLVLAVAATLMALWCERGKGEGRREA